MNALTTSEQGALAGIRPGLHFDIDINAYHGGPGISKSGLDSINANPAIYYARHLDPSRPSAPERGGQLEGTLAHCAILEPGEFTKRYAVVPKDAPRRPTEAQWNAKKPGEDSIAAMAWWKEWMATSGGATVVTSEQYETALRQADSVRRLPEVAQALERGHAETSAYWTDPVTGELCRCRPDWVYEVNDTSVILLDVKTCGDASPAEFRRLIARKRYDVQDAFYSDGYSLASKKDVLAFIFLAVESEWPYAACAVMLDDAGKANGARAYRRNLDTYAQCRRTGVWPGYSDQIEIVQLPNWAIKEEA